MPNDVPSFLWWFFSVVILGIVIGLVPAYLKPRIDDFLAKYSKSRKEKLEQKAREFEENVNLMLTDVGEFIYVDVRRIQIEILMATMIVIAFISLVIIAEGGVYLLSSPGFQSCTNPSIVCLSPQQALAFLLLESFGYFFYLLGMFGLGFLAYSVVPLSKLLGEYRRRKKEIRKAEKLQITNKISKETKTKKSPS